MKLWLAVFAPQTRGELPEAMIKLYRSCIQEGVIGFRDKNTIGFVLTSTQEAQLRLDLYLDGTLSHAAYEICRIVKFHGCDVRVLEAK